MVQITDPNESPGVVDRLAVGPPDFVDSGAITQSAVDGLEPGIGYLPGSNPNPPPLQEPAPGPTQRPTDDPEEYQPEANDVWQSQSTRRKTQLAMVAFLSLFGLIAAAVVFSQFVRTWQQQKTAAGAASVDAHDSVDEDSATSELAREDVELTAEPVLTVSPVVPAAEPSIPIEQAMIEPASPPLASPEIEAQATTAVNAATRVDPNEKPGENQRRPGEAESPPALNNLPPELRKYAPLASLSTSDHQTAQLMQPPPTIDTVRIDDAAVEGDPAVEANALRKPVDVEKAFAQRFALENNGSSIAELMLLISQLTTVPIEIDLIALDAAGIRAEAPIRTPTGWMATRQWIDTTCQSLGLVANNIDGRVTITALDERLDAGISGALRLDDFGDDAANVFRWLSPLLDDEEPTDNGEDDVAVAAEVTSLAEDGQSIIARRSLRSRVSAALSIEAIRMMRGKPAKLERWRTSRWMGPWPSQDAVSDGVSFGDWPLVTGGDGGPRLDSPRAAAGLLRAIASLNEKDILVGWYDATRQGLYPSDPVMPYSREASAAGMLEEIVAEHGLQTRVCGPALWYVCSEARYDRFEVIAWYDIPPGTGEAVLTRIAQSLSIVDVSTLPAVFDDKHLLIRCPRYLARQIPRIIAP